MPKAFQGMECKQHYAPLYQVQTTGSITVNCFLMKDARLLEVEREPLADVCFKKILASLTALAVSAITSMLISG